MSKRYTWIDGIYVEVRKCELCPFYDSGDEGFGDCCNYPQNHAQFYSANMLAKGRVAEDCPLRVKE